MPNKFIWTDLSTFEVQSCKDFYSRLFGWQFASRQRSVEGDYHLASQDTKSVAALYTMPKLYQDFNMPSFWMSYIQVSDINEIVDKARQHQDVVIEIEPTAFDEQSQFALIRDPAGAGFTVYEGPDLEGRFENGHGRMVQNVLHVNDKNLIEHFYKDVFDWSLQHSASNPQFYEVTNQAGEVIAHVEVLLNEIKGDKQYWMPIFAVADKAKARQNIKDMNGSVLMDLDDVRSMCADSQGGHFIIQQDFSKQTMSVGKTDSSSIRGFKWKTMIGLLAIWWAVFADATWFWGILFLLVILPDIRRGETHFIEYLTARENPILFWLLMSSWILLSLYLIINPFL